MKRWYVATNPRVTGATAFHFVTVGALMLSCYPAAALYAEIKPPEKVGVGCIGGVSLLAPELSACTIAGMKARIWCPNGQMFEGTMDQGGPQIAIARSLCQMSQVP